MKLVDVSDYYDRLQQKYPNIPRSDLIKVARYGLQQIVKSVISKTDINIINYRTGFRAAIGFKFKNQAYKFKYYRTKLVRRMLYLYNQANIAWDHYYYFTITGDLLEKWKKAEVKKGFVFTNINLCKDKDICLIRTSKACALFKYYSEEDYGMLFTAARLKLDSYGLVLERERILFKDYSVSLNNFPLLDKSDKNYKKYINGRSSEHVRKWYGSRPESFSNSK